jgi:luciferase family oxidoreductase group 1
MIALSALELAMVETGRSATDALAQVTEVARRAEGWGFRRIWFAEHHAAAAIASASPPVLAAHLAASTSRIRIGSGGVMAPNHAPLAIAEQFVTLSALHPGRVDLGVGRGPGALDQRVIRALRRGADPADDDYRADVLELLGYLSGESEVPVLPGSVPIPQPWLLASSTGGAELAAELGLPIALAHHIRPANTFESLERYREKFRPSRWSSEPAVILAVETICADTDDEAAYLAGPRNVLRTRLLDGRGGDVELVSPEDAAVAEFGPEATEQIRQHRADQALGAPGTVARRLGELVDRTGVDELMLVTPVYDAERRARSYELVAKVLGTTES